MAARFTGNYPHTLDDKGRLIIPRKFRDLIERKEGNEELVVTMAPDSCLFLYTANHWEQLNLRQEGLNLGSRDLWQFQRAFHANAETLIPDKQGRVHIPDRLRQLARIDHEIVLAGCFDRIEIWDRATWAAAQEEAWKTYGEHAGAFLAGGGVAPAPASS